MIDKFKKFFFTEDGGEDDIEERERLDDYSDEEEVELEHFQAGSVLAREKELHTYVEPVQPEVSTPKITIDIKADEPSFKTTEVKQPRVLQRRDEYEMPQVISPYFGVKGEETHIDKDGVQLNKVPTKKKETFNSVISPFYGTKESKPMVETAKEVSEEVQAIPAFVEKMPFAHTYETLEDEKEEVNISLDEIISNQSEEADDLIQFSLFGGSEKIQKNAFENEDWNEESEDSDVLPF